MTRINIYDVIHSKYAAYQVEGDTVFNVIDPLIKEGKPVALSYEGVNQVTYSFLFAIYGRLYSEYGEHINKKLTNEHTGVVHDFDRKLEEVINKIKHRDMLYFGTDLTRAGHYFWKIEGDSMGYSSKVNMSFNDIPFDPYSYPKYDKGVSKWKGDYEFYQENGYSIYAIYGSPADDRHGTHSVFFIKEALTQDEMLEKIKSIPIGKRILESFPFELMPKGSR